jgi:translation initiation factor 5A
MVFKLINATDAKVGTNIIVEGVACVVKKMDISKTGKHGHAKVRVEAVDLISGVKKVFVVPGHERIEIPLVEKRKAQVLSTKENKVSIMDLENFETIELDIPEELKEEIKENVNVEYWDIEGTKIIKRIT